VNSSGSGQVGYRVQINDLTTILEGAHEPEGSDSTEWVQPSCVYVFTAGASTQIDFDFLQVATGTASMRRKRAVLIKVT
jgi:hypothetical protein